MAYQQRKFRAAQQKPQGNPKAPRIKKIGIDDLDESLKEEVGEAMQAVLEQAQATVAALQSNVAEALRPLSTSPLLNGNLLFDVRIPANGARVAHGLGRPIIGYVIVGTRSGSTATGNLIGSPTKTPERDIFLSYASGTATVNLYVF